MVGETTVEIIKFVILFILAFIIIMTIGLICTDIGESMLSTVQNSENAKSLIETVMLLLPGPLDAFGLIKNSLYSILMAVGIKVKVNI
jgi:hypothetical protein